MKLKSILSFIVAVVVLSGCSHVFAGPSVSSANIDADAKAISAQAKGLNPKIAKLALTAYHNANTTHKVVNKKPVLTIINYEAASTEPRLFVVDLSTKKVLFKELVAHGKHSGGNYVKAVSNKGQSRMSSVGVFLTGQTYQGSHGYSMRLAGLEPGFNDKALSRAIVVHGANYVNKEFAKRHGRLGLSWGCPALDPKVVRPVIDKIKGGTIVFAYYPHPEWLQKSKFLRRV